MEDRLTLDRRSASALATLALILAISAAWWALALWPMPATTPVWLARTREVCFGNMGESLPSAGGWVLLLGEPAGMLGILFAAWGDAVRHGLRALWGGVPGRLMLGASGLALLAGAGWVGGRVHQARAAEAFDPREASGGRPERVDLAAPPLRLVNQAGDTIGLARYAGRPVIVTFAYAHCQTVCPTIVHDLVAASSRLGDGAPDILIVTLDPWRDTPSRLGAIAQAWELPPGAHVLSGAVAEVERTLDAWRVPRARDGSNGELAHPRLAYLVGPAGRIAYRLDGGTEAVIAAVGELSRERLAGT